MDSDLILEKCGDFGRYQILVVILFGVLNIFVSQHYFAQTLISFTPEHWCYHEKLENRTFDEIRDIYSKFENPSCTKLEDITNDSTVIASSETCSKWIYNYDYGYHSLSTELNWVCDSAYKSSLGQSTFFIGSAFGTLVYGLLSDKYGRLPILVVSNLSAFIGDFATVFLTSDVVTFSISRFISGLAADTNTYLMYIIALEYVRPSMRVITINLGIGIFYCLGLVITPWLAVLVGHWKYYLLLTSSPFILIITYYFMISESTQWLVTQNNVDGAIKRLKRIAKFNKREVSERHFDEFRKHCEAERSTASEKIANFLDLFKTPRLRNQTFILFYLSMVGTLCYNTVSRDVEGNGVDPFIMFSLSNIMVLPSGFILIFLQNKIGRKGMAVSSLSYCAIITIASCVFHAVSTEQNQIALVALQMLARFGVAMSYEAINQFATDLIPTCVRGQGVAVVHVSGFAASFLSTPIIYLAAYLKSLPSIILTVLFFSSAVLSLFLPETANKNLPKTLKDGEEFGKHESRLHFICLKKHNDDIDCYQEKVETDKIKY